MARNSIMARSATSNRQVIRDFGTSIAVPGGSNAYISTLSNGVWSTAKTNITMSAWFKSFDYRVNRQCIISNGTSAGGGHGYALILSGSGDVDGSMYLLNHNVAWIALNFKVQDNKWHQIMLTIDGSNNAVVYLDGVSRYTGTPTLGTPDNNSNFGTDGVGRFYGLLDEGRFYARKLSATEASDLYFGREPVPGPANWYKFDEGSGSTVNDSGSNPIAGASSLTDYSTNVFIKARSAASNRVAVGGP